MRAAVSIVIVAAVASCLVNRKSEEFACSDDTDCAAMGRACERGYCVERPVDANPCPSICSDCDFAAKTCTITCDTPNDCNNISCPLGYDCTINCTRGQACDNISCLVARSCTVNCTMANACKDVTCGPGRCTVTCSGGASACQDVVCDSSCGCDVTCAAGQCTSMDCPMGTTMPCTTDGLPASQCNSMTQAGCLTCP